MTYIKACDIRVFSNCLKIMYLVSIYAGVAAVCRQHIGCGIKKLTRGGSLNCNIYFPLLNLCYVYVVVILRSSLRFLSRAFFLFKYLSLS